MFLTNQQKLQRYMITVRDDPFLHIEIHPREAASFEGDRYLDVRHTFSQDCVVLASSLRMPGDSRSAPFSPKMFLIEDASNLVIQCIPSGGFALQLMNLSDY